MRSLGLVLMVAAACGDPGKTLTLIDGSPDDTPVDVFVPFGPCNIVTQAGCAAGYKCTVLHIPITGGFERRVGCAPAPNEGLQTVGYGCQYGTPTNEPSYDNCVAGTVCTGTCKAVCNTELGDTACDSTHACQPYPELFPDQTMPVPGLCEAACDPLDDNDFDGSESTLTRTGTACGSAVNGCYGYPSFGNGKPTPWICAPDVYGALSDGRQNEQGHPYINGCDQGYVFLNGFCHALCKPGNTYQGNPTTQYTLGQSPHACNTTDARGTFYTTDRCVYLWRLEISDTGTFTRSPRSDTVGICLSGGGSWPSCDTLPLTAASGPTAADYGCIDTATAPALPTTRLQGY